jgi:transcriptional regulator with XRE-family HTH domain
MKSFSTVLSALRKETGLSQRHVASDLGVSQALLSHYENGAREPKLEFVIKACDYYNVTADYILGRNEERAGNPARLAESLGGVVDELQVLKSTGDAIIERISQWASSGNNGGNEK